MEALFLLNKSSLNNYSEKNELLIFDTINYSLREYGTMKC